MSTTQPDFKVSQTYAGRSDNNMEERMQEALVYGGVLRGAGSPENVVVASVGTLYLRTDGGVNTTLYVKQTGAGNTGWGAK